VADAPAIALTDPAEALRRAQQGKGYWRRVWERLRQDRFTLAIAAILAFLLIMVVFAPWFTAHDPYEASVLRRLKPVGFPGHWLGTDEVGRDLWARMVYGGRLSLLAGVLPVFLALLFGGFLGVLAGYAGGLVNSAIMRLTDVLYAFPSVLLAIAITGILGSGLRNTILALTAAFVPPLIRISESVAAQARHLDYVDAARASGAGPLMIMRYHILNNVLGPILVYATSLISIGIILAAGLSFLGLGVTPPDAEWGLMLNNLRQALWVDR
jgi:peptide/nickel transport system permease protein